MRHCSSNAFSMVSDGSEVQKTGMDKELVFVRLIKGGISVYYCVALRECRNFRGTDAESLKKAIDEVFNNKVKISDEKSKYGIVSAMADGASENFGKYNRLITRMKSVRPWLVGIHRIAHQAELSLMDTLLKIKEFKQF